VGDKTTSTREFCDDDAGYRVWLGAHPEGAVINIARSHNATRARVHRASCWTINGQDFHGDTWTGLWVKVCAERLDQLEQWASDQVREPIQPCGICHPAPRPV
jgi:hypothetical protein